jgi:KDO2-lipid IV(A) lauroyltransferase
LYRLLPLRRQVVLDNLRRVYGERADATEITRLAQAHYGHLGRLFWEFLWYPWLSRARKLALVRVENLDALLAAHAQGKGVLILTGHFGNFEVATSAGLASFPEAKGRFHFVRRPIRPEWLDKLVTRRFRKAGFGVLPKRGGLDAILDRLAAGDLVVFPFDQHAQRKDGVQVEFFGHPAGTFRSLAVIALSTGAPVVPASCWRESDGNHVLRFEAPLTAVEDADANEAIRLTTRAFNRALELLIVRRPEQWWWVHRRWKPWPKRKRST